jgi:hypothetical protein
VIYSVHTVQCLLVEGSYFRGIVSLPFVHIGELVDRQHTNEGPWHDC